MLIIRNGQRFRMTDMTLDRNAWIRLAVAAGVAISGGVHLRLYRSGYRDIHLDRVLGVDLSRSFALAVAVAAVVSVGLVATVVWERAGRVWCIAAAVYAAGALLAYALARTTGLLGFEESRWITEAVVAKPIELAVLVLAVAGATARPAAPSA